MVLQTGRIKQAGLTSCKPTIPQRRNFLCRSSFRDWLDSLAYERWAPRSAQAWRLRPAPGESELKAENTGLEETTLQARIRELGISDIDDTAEIDTLSPSSMLDRDLQEVLDQRISQLSAAGSFDGGEDDRQQLTGALLRRWIFAKYGKTYDLSIVRRDIPGKTLVRLNVMWTHLEQRSFPMTEREFMEKLDIIAFHISAWRQEAKVMAFFKQRPRAQKGLPARPTTGTAISIPLDLSPAVIEEWFGRS